MEKSENLKEQFQKKNLQNFYDVLVVGGGPAGLTSAIFAKRKGLNVIIVSKDIGGQLNMASIIENIPGIKKISGEELIFNLLEHVNSLNIKIELDEVVNIEKKGEKEFVVRTLRGKEFLTKAIILAIGREHKRLLVPGEKEFLGKGVSYCFVCDGPLYKDKVVAVIGGGDSAFRACEYLSSIAKKVYLIHRRDEFRAEKSLIDTVKSRKNVNFILNSVIKEIKGDNKVRKIILEDLKRNLVFELEVDGVFIEIGFEVRNDLIKSLGLKTNENGEIIVDNLCRTNVSGIFAAGDCTSIPYKQIVIAYGMGAIAALEAYKYIKS